MTETTVAETIEEVDTGPVCDPDDSDCDGVLDPQDNCPAVKNADQLDCDGSVYGDACFPTFADQKGKCRACLEGDIPTDGLVAWFDASVNVEAADGFVTRWAPTEGTFPALVPLADFAAPSVGDSATLAGQKAVTLGPDTMPISDGTPMTDMTFSVFVAAMSTDMTARRDLVSAGNIDAAGNFLLELQDGLSRAFAVPGAEDHPSLDMGPVDEAYTALGLVVDGTRYEGFAEMRRCRSP